MLHVWQASDKFVCWQGKHKISLHFTGLLLHHYFKILNILCFKANYLLLFFYKQLVFPPMISLKTYDFSNTCIISKPYLIYISICCASEKKVGSISSAKPTGIHSPPPPLTRSFEMSNHTSSTILCLPTNRLSPIFWNLAYALKKEMWIYLYYESLFCLLNCEWNKYFNKNNLFWLSFVLIYC